MIQFHLGNFCLIAIISAIIYFKKSSQKSEFHPLDESLEIDNIGHPETFTKKDSFGLVIHLEKLMIIA